MSLINIGGNSNDLNYRYKRNLLEVVYENAKGVQTKIHNLERVAKQLNVSSEKITTFLKKQMGVSITLNLLKGRFTVQDLEKQLEKFIKVYVLCPKCTLPEWNGESCNACGHTSGKVKHELEFEPITHVSDADIIISQMMHCLYDLLEDTAYNKDQLELINSALEYCWDQPSDCDYNRILKRINKKLDVASVKIEKIKIVGSIKTNE